MSGRRGPAGERTPGRPGWTRTAEANEQRHGGAAGRNARSMRCGGAEKNPAATAGQEGRPGKNTGMRFEDLTSCEPLLRAIREQGWTTPTPIQAKAIPAAKEGKDVVGIAQTGTGKTGAFLIPSLERQ